MDIENTIYLNKGLDEILEDASKIKFDLDSIISILDEALDSEEEHEDDGEIKNADSDKKLLFSINEISEKNAARLEKFKKDLSFLSEFEGLDDVLSIDTSILTELFRKNSTKAYFRFNLEEYISEVEEVRNIIDAIILILKLNVKVSSAPSSLVIVHL